VSLSQEWAWTAAIAAIPAIAYAALEMTLWVRRRRLEAVARRPKDPRRGRAGREG